MTVEVHQHAPRNGTAATWNSRNPVLRDGEFGVEKDTGKLKIGDGSTQWTALPYINDLSFLQADLDGRYVTQAAGNATYGQLVPSGDAVRYVTASGSDSNNGRSWGTAFSTVAAAKAALPAAGGLIELGLGTFSYSTGIDLQNVIIRGSGNGRTTLAYTGAGGSAITQTSGARTYRPGLRDLTLSGAGASGTTVGLEVLNSTLGRYDNVAVTNFTTGIKLNAPDASGQASYYNTFTHVAAENCTVGYDLGYRVNENRFYACRANNCVTGYKIVDGNHNVFLDCEAAAFTTAFTLSVSSASRCRGNVIAFCRIELGTNGIVVGAGVPETVITHPYWESITTPYSDSGDRTFITDPSATGAKGFQYVTNLGTDKTSFYLERVAPATDVPAMHVVDSNSGSGLPVTIQATTERALGSFFRGVRGGTTYFDVNAQGHVTMQNSVIKAALDHDGTTIGFFGTTPITKRTVSGSVSGDTAGVLDLLCSQLASYGLILDSTTA